MRHCGAAAAASVVAAVSLGFTLASPAAAASAIQQARAPVHAPAQARGKPRHGHAAAHPARKASHLGTAVKSPRRDVHVAPRAPRTSRVLSLAGCYGRFIGWRDQLSALMLQANSYTPWPDDKIRFDRMERAFAAAALTDRKLVLSLQPAFKESDFPPDIRLAFHAGLEAAEAVFADGAYQHTQILVVGQPDLSPLARMAQLEANADQAFAPLAGPCERVTRR